MISFWARVTREDIGQEGRVKLENQARAPSAGGGRWAKSGAVALADLSK